MRIGASAAGETWGARARACGQAVGREADYTPRGESGCMGLGGKTLMPLKGEGRTDLGGCCCGCTGQPQR